MDTSTILSRMGQGDEQVWGQFAERMLPKLRNTIRRLNNDQEAVEDAAHEILGTIISVLGHLIQEDGVNSQTDKTS